jgi:hypothetical protein
MTNKVSLFLLAFTCANTSHGVQADPTAGQRIAKSAGSMQTVMEFLPQSEQIQMQGLNRDFYKRIVGSAFPSISVSNKEAFEEDVKAILGPNRDARFDENFTRIPGSISQGTDTPPLPVHDSIQSLLRNIDANGTKKYVFQTKSYDDDVKIHNMLESIMGRGVSYQHIVQDLGNGTETHHITLGKNRTPELRDSLLGSQVTQNNLGAEFKKGENFDRHTGAARKYTTTYLHNIDRLGNKINSDLDSLGRPRVADQQNDPQGQ